MLCVEMEVDQRPVVDGPGQQQQWDAPSAVDAVVSVVSLVGQWGAWVMGEL